MEWMFKVRFFPSQLAVFAIWFTYVMLLIIVEDLIILRNAVSTVTDATRPMIRFEPGGRMCNRMFQHASLHGIAERNGFQPITESSMEYMDCFQYNATSNKEATFENFTNVYRGDLYFAQDFFHLNKTTRFYEFHTILQSYKFFGHIDEQVRTMFKMRQKYVDYSNEILHKLKRRWPDGPVTFVSVQARRTDFAEGKWSELINAVTPSYLNTAMTLFNDTFQNVQFVIVSDDIEWCRKNIKTKGFNAFFSHIEDGCKDFAILTSVNHSIITSGSSFGYWGKSKVT